MQNVIDRGVLRGMLPRMVFKLLFINGLEENTLIHSFIHYFSLYSGQLEIQYNIHKSLAHNI